MKIHILTFYPNKPELAPPLQMLQAAATKQGHELEFIFAKECQMRLFGKPEIIYQGKPLKKTKGPILVRPSFHGLNGDFNVTLLEQFEKAGHTLLNGSTGVRIAKNKIRMLQTFQAHHIPMPKSYVVRSVEQLEGILPHLGHFPLVMKSSAGSKGIGVTIIESMRGLTATIQMMMHDDDRGPLIIQEFVKEALGSDIRAFVVDGKVIAAMQRSAQSADEFRSNFSLGGKVQEITLTPKERTLAIKTAHVCGLDIAGVDIIRTKDGPKILEINSNPGIEGITEATGKDIAGEIISYLVSLHKK